MKPPFEKPEYREHQHECREMLRSELPKLRERALAAGWDADHFAEALVEVSGELFRERVSSLVGRH